MPGLPVVSGKETINALEKVGWQAIRREGSHVILTRAGMPAVLSVPDHRELKRGTLRSLIRKAGLTVEEFIALLRS